MLNFLYFDIIASISSEEDVLHKKLFKFLNSGGTRCSCIDRSLLCLGITFLLCGLVFRVLEKFSALGPESGSFFLLGIFLAVLGVVGMGIAKFRRDDARDK
jgi:hypothetical protein